MDHTVRRQPSQRAQIIRHVAELSNHLGITEFADGGITSAAECDCTDMPFFTGKRFGPHYSRVGIKAFDRLARCNAIISSDERQRHVIRHIDHGSTQSYQSL
jgi:hypothetical protein